MYFSLRVKVLTLVFKECSGNVKKKKFLVLRWHRNTFLVFLSCRLNRNEAVQRVGITCVQVWPIKVALTGSIFFVLVEALIGMKREQSETARFFCCCCDQHFVRFHRQSPLLQGVKVKVVVVVLFPARGVDSVD